jgi:hypothetical protein
MTTSNPPNALARAASESCDLYLSGQPDRYLVAPGGQRLGRLSDVIVRLRGTTYPLVTGLVAKVARRTVDVPVGQVSTFAGDTVRLGSASFDLRGSSAAMARCCCARTCSGTG